MTVGWGVPAVCTHAIIKDGPTCIVQASSAHALLSHQGSRPGISQAIYLLPD